MKNTKRPITKRLGFCCLGLLFAGATWAQTSGAEAAKVLALSTRLEDASLTRPPVSREDATVVELTEKGSEARFRIAGPTSNGTWSVTFAAPIDDTTKEAEAINLDGFSNGVSLALDYSRFDVSKTKYPAKEFTERKELVCGAFFEGLGEEKQNEIWAATEEKPGFKKYRKRKVDREGLSPKAALIQTRCVEDTDDQYDLPNLMGEDYRKLLKQELLEIDPNTPELQQLRRSLFVERKWLPGFSLGAKVGTDDFDFVELAPSESLGVASESERKESHSLSASFGLLGVGGAKSDSVFWLTYKRSRSYEDAKSAEICEPLDGSDFESCADKPFGPPTEKDQELAIAEFKTLFTKTGLAARIFHDFESEKSGAGLDFFFLKNNKGALTAGAGVKWVDGGDLTGSIFLKKGFAWGPG